MLVTRDVKRQIQRHRAEMFPFYRLGGINDDVFSYVEMRKLFRELRKDERGELEGEGTNLAVELGEDRGEEGFGGREGGEGGAAGNPFERGERGSCVFV